MGVADVHVAVDEPRRDHEMPRVDYAVGARCRELVGPPHAADASVLDEDGAVPDDSPLVVDADDVAGAVDLEAGLRHDRLLSGPRSTRGRSGSSGPRWFRRRSGTRARRDSTSRRDN